MNSHCPQIPVKHTTPDFRFASFGSTLLIVLALAIGGCSKQSPESLLTSARDYLSKGDQAAAIIQLKNLLQEKPNDPEGRFLLARALGETGDAAAAEVEYRKAIDAGYDAEKVVAPLAQAMLDQGQPKKVIEEFGGKASADGAPPELMAMVGEAQLAMGQRDLGRALIQTALSRSPQSARVKLAVARLDAADGKLPEALQVLDSVLAGSQAPIEHFLLKGAILAATNEKTKAIETYRQAIAAHPKEVEPRSRLISLLIADQKLEAAKQSFAELEKLAPRDLRTAYLKALIAVTEGRFADARDPILRVLKVNPEHVPSLLLAGLVEYQTKSYEQAETNLRKVVDRVPNQEYPRRLLVSSYLRSGKLQRAQEAVQPLLKDASTTPELAALVGEVYLTQGDFAKAAEYYEKATTLAPVNASLRARLGAIRVRTGDVDRAVQDLEAASAENKDQYQADLALIVVQLNRRQPDKALEAIATLERKLKDSPLVENLRGVAYLAKQDLQKARESFQKALTLQPTFFAAAQNLARMDLQDKKPDEAIKRFQAILDKEPTNEQALLAQAALLMGQNKTEAARPLIEKALAAHPQSLAPRLAQIQMHLRSRDLKSALSVAQEAQSIAPNDPKLLEVLGLVQQATGNGSQAVATFQKLAEVLPNSAEPQVRLAAAYLALKDSDSALRALRKALEIDPNQSQVQRDLARLYYSTGRQDQALAEARKIQQQSPKSPAGYLIEGDILAGKNDLKAAESVIRRGVKQTDSASLVVRLHTLLLVRNSREEAASLIDKWTRDHPDDLNVPIYLAESDMRRGNFKSSLEKYRQIIVKRPNNALLLNNMAWVASQIKDPEALQYAEHAFELAPGNPVIMDTYGMILVQTGNAARGIDLLSQAATLGPQIHQIRLHLAKALAESGRKAEARKELDALGKLPEGSESKRQADEIRKSL